MRPRPLLVICTILALFPLFSAVGFARATEVLSLAVREGSCECVLPAEHAGDTYFLIVGALARTAGPHRILLTTAATSAPVHIPLEQEMRGGEWKNRVDQLAGRQAQARKRPAAQPTTPPHAPAREKNFSLFTGGHDFRNRESYATVRAVLRGVGRHCQVYVDRDDLEADLDGSVADVLRTFDEEVYPQARRNLGHATDVDDDGRFTVLFTRWLGRLQTGNLPVSGFVRGSDFYRELQRPFGNSCDMMYLSSSLRPGPHLRTVLAHEYAHAVIFCEHVFGDYLSGVARADEDSWLNEGIAHLVEHEHSFGWTNLDYRVSAALNAPERYRLVVADYYGTGLWRAPGVRGITYLFLRWCADRHGVDLSERLVRSNLQGVDNLEVATGERFETLFRQWAVALLLTGTGLESEGGNPLRRLGPRRPLGNRLLAGPRFEEVALSGERRELQVAGTAVKYVQLVSAGGMRARVTLVADPAVELQATLVRVPRSYPRLSVRAEALPQPGTFRLHLTCHGGKVTLQHAAWERMLPSGLPEETNYRADESERTVRSWFGDPRLEEGEVRSGAPFTVVTENGCYVVRVTAMDGQGRRLVGWTQLRPGEDTPK